jgi:hypothetical protein
MKVQEKFVHEEEVIHPPIEGPTQLAITITALALGVICMITGSIALAAVHGKLPAGASSALNSFSKVGRMNAFILFFGGAGLSLLSTVALSYVSRRKLVF